MPRSPHSSYLHPKWGVDPTWTRLAGGGGAIENHSGGQMLLLDGEPAPAVVAAPATAKRTAVRTATTKRTAKPAAIHPLACISLGVIVERAGSCCPRNNWHTCNAGQGDRVQPATTCETCAAYVATPPD